MHALSQVRRVLDTRIPELGAALLAIESLLAKRFERLTTAADEVADANVRGVELLAQETELREHVQKQNGVLRAQKELIERQAAHLEAQAMAAAHANVEAVLFMDDHEVRLSAVDAERARLAVAYRELAEKTHDLEQQAGALAESNVEAAIVMDERNREINRLARKARAMARRGAECARRATIDPLTGVKNRGAFDAAMQHAVARARRYDEPLSLLFVDADHFKQINDRHGHPTGDEVLRSLAELIASEVRATDTTARGSRAPLAARYGGEEFVVLLPRTPTEGAALVAERIRERAERAIHGDSAGTPVRATVSIGVSTLGPDEDVDGLLRRADAALYRAKAAGRNRVSIAIAPAVFALPVRLVG